MTRPGAVASEPSLGSVHKGITTMDLFLQQLVSGISIGAIYSLLAVGYALVYSVYNFTNWAFDGFMAFGAFMGFTAIASLAMPFWVAVIVSMLLTVGLSVGVETAPTGPCGSARRRGCS